MEHGIAWLIAYLIIELSSLFTNSANRAQFPPKQEATQTMEPMWTRVEDGEYNEQYLDLGSKGMIVLFSDRDAKQWTFTKDGGDPTDLGATDEFGARREVLRIINQK